MGTHYRQKQNVVPKNRNMKIWYLCKLIPKDPCFIEFPSGVLLFWRGPNYTALPNNTFADYINLRPLDNLS